MVCANCGNQGHVHRICSQPISSFGLVCFRCVRSASDAVTVEYLMVQRKDSLSFVEFIRGKYNLQNKGYIMRLLSNMTVAERIRLQTCTFDELWHGFWQNDHGRSFMKEYDASSAKFQTLRKGYFLRAGVTPDISRLSLRCEEGGDEEKNGGGEEGEESTSTLTSSPAAAAAFFSLSAALNATADEQHVDTEFGFPKGRRNMNETDLRAACREFHEETKVDLQDVRVIPGMRPFEEVFTGSNHVRYRHVYYLARLREGAQGWGATAGGQAVPTTDAVQLREVKAVGWFDAAGVLQRIRPHNVERRGMFRAIHELVTQTLLVGPETS